MSGLSLFGLCGSALIGVGLYGLIVNPQPLRKILAFNMIGSGVFLLFGVVARRGAALGMGGDPVPQALVITGLLLYGLYTIFNAMAFSWIMHRPR